MYKQEYSEEIKFEDMTAEEILSVSLRVIQDKKWSISYLESDLIVDAADISRKSWGETIEIRILREGMALVMSYYSDDNYRGEDKNKGNVKSFIESLNSLMQTIKADEIERLSEEYNKLSSEMINENIRIERVEPFRFYQVAKLIRPDKEFFATHIILGIYYAVFLAMLFSGVNSFVPSEQELTDWGASYMPLVNSGEYYRLLAGSFLHVGILHLLFNTLLLLTLGRILEPILGWLRFLAVYIISGILGNLTTNMFCNQNFIEPGSTDAIVGLGGLLYAFYTIYLADKEAWKSIAKYSAIGLGVALVFLLLKGSISPLLEHVGGIAGGTACGYILYPFMPKTEDKNIFNTKPLTR